MSATELVLAGGVALMAPILWAALGELITEKAGMLNIGIEGVMILGAFTTAAAYQGTGSATVAVLTGLGSGVTAGILLGILYIRIGTDQIVTGIVVTAMALGATTVLAERLLGDARASSIPPVDIPGLSAIPVLGPILFRHNLLVYGAILAVPCVAYLIRRTWFGLHVRAAGERPLVVATAGLSVRKLRFTALVIGCALVAVGGATLILSTAGTFQPGSTGGRGYIALAVVVVARWNPFLAMGGAFLFGVAGAFQFQAERLPLVSAIPYDFLLMAPYLVAVAAVFLIRGSRYPASIGVPYRTPGTARDT